ncbi:MAG TPA: PEGA domain-containing protein [Vicinamibacterales bacterium]|nr:PEGA domain-containing protein [Vicinamibacterales bacterium]
MTAGPDDGRFGPVYLGRDPESGASIVIRTFSETMTVEQLGALEESLSKLCAQPLEHPSISRALTCGVEDGVPFVVHEAMAGTPVDEYLDSLGPRPLTEVARRVGQLAEAFDFAAAAGVHHGALGPRDVAFQFEATSVSGFGLTQALREAGLDTNEPSLADDIYALAAMAFELLLGRRYEGGDVRAAVAGLGDSRGVRVDALAGALESALAPDPRLWPPTAQEFAASLRRASMSAGGAGAAADANVGRLTLSDEALPPSSVPPPSREPDAPRAPLELSALEETPLLMFEPEAHHPEPEPLPPAPGDPPVEEPAYSEPAFREPVLRETEEVRLHTPAYDPPPRMTPRTPVVAPGLLRPDVRPIPYRESSNARVFGVVVVASIVLLGAVGTGVFLAQRTTNDAADRSTPESSEGQATPPPVTPEAGTAAGAASNAAGDDPAGAAGAPAATQSPGTGSVSQSPPTTGNAAQPSSTAAAEPGGDAAVNTAAPPPAPVPPAASPATPPAPSANAQTGRLLIRSTPAGALVVVDGQPRGETPLAVRGLEFGSHTVSVSGAGLPRWERRIMLTPEHPSESFEIGTPGTSSAVTEGPASLQVDSRPAGARVFVDGMPVGSTPLVLPDVTAGSHTVRIEMPGYRPWITTITLSRGMRSRVGASLEP